MQIFRRHGALLCQCGQGVAVPGKGGGAVVGTEQLHGQGQVDIPGGQGGGLSGQTTDIKIHADRIIKIKENLNRIMAERCHKPLEQVMQDTERDNFMSAEEARAYGLIDRVITHRE